MRLIDGDALIKAVDGNPFTTDSVKSYIRVTVAKMPTAEPKRGEWTPIHKGERGYSAGDFRCSVCHQPNKCYIVTNYCSHCGALMRDK